MGASANLPPNLRKGWEKYKEVPDSGHPGALLHSFIHTYV